MRANREFCVDTLTYAGAAARSGRTDLANVWRTVGEVEHQDHWTHETTLANLYSGSDNVANLKAAIRQAQQTATADRGWAAKAPKGSTAAAQLSAIARREDAAAQLLTRALAALQGHGSMPTNATNLKASIASEQGAIDMYTQYAPQAQKAGDSSVGSVFLSIKGDEMGHHQTFTSELQLLTTAN